MAEVQESSQVVQVEPPRWEATGEVKPREGGRPVGFSGSEYQRAGEGLAGHPGKSVSTQNNGSTKDNGSTQNNGSTQVKARPTFRRYTRQYKLQVLKDTDTLGEGEVGAYLRREGLYYSTLKMFREHRTRGMLDESANANRGAAGSSNRGSAGKGGSRQKATDPSGTGSAVVVPAETQRRMNELEKENRKLRHRLRQTDALLELQKKASEFVGISLEGIRQSEE